MPRPTWRGSISFGLVNVPVRVYRATAASSGHQISFHQIHSTCGTRIQYKRWCPTEDREVAWDEIAKGYEFEKGRFTMVSEDELAELPKPEQAAIAIDGFVEAKQIDPLLLDRAYYVAPDGPAKAYLLLTEVMRETGRVAIGRMALRTRAHVALLRAVAERLVLHTLFFAEEVVNPASLPAPPPRVHAPARELQMARELCERMAMRFQPEALRDDYTAKLRQLIERKIEGQEIVAAPLIAAEGGQIVNLVDALKRSLAERSEAAGQQKRVRPRRAGVPARRARHKKAS
jgi:DNA end-binding protein Ku